MTMLSSRGSSCLSAVPRSLAGSRPAAAQQADLGRPDRHAADALSAGWSLTPSLVLSQTCDDNVLLHGPGDPQDERQHQRHQPARRASCSTARARRSRPRYDGAFVRSIGLYRLSTATTSTAAIGGKRQLSKRVSFFLERQRDRSAPTTELLQFIGVPFVRTGVFDRRRPRRRRHRRDEAARRCRVDGRFEQAQFDATQPFAEPAARRQQPRRRPQRLRTALSAADDADRRLRRAARDHRPGAANRSTSSTRPSASSAS